MEPEQQPTVEPQETPQLTKKQRRALKKQEKWEEGQRAVRGKKAKTALAWLAAVAAIALGLWWLVARSNSTGSAHVPPSSGATAEDWSKGGANAAVTVIEYSDFQCPACGTYFPIMKQLTEEFGESVRFAYRHFPLRAIHPNAAKAAQAAEAAGAQNAFWKMHDMLFERQSEWADVRDPFELFSGYAQTIGLDGAQFAADYHSDAFKSKVRAHETAGRRIGINATPTFLVNGEKIDNPRGYEAFRALLVSLVGEPEAQTPNNGDTPTTTQQAL